MIGHRVGIVVLTFNRRDELSRTLSKLEAIDDVPIVVVDNASTDGTAEAIARDHPRVRVVMLSKNMGAAGRNAGARACERRYIAFCDDDTWWRPESIECAAAALDTHPSLAAVTARVLVGEDGREDPTNARMAASPLPNTLGIRGSELVGLLGGACMVRRDAFLAVGGYHPRLFLGGEEALLAIHLRTAGWRMAYLPDAVVHHHPSALRDARARQRLAIRNALWCAWLRRPLSSAIDATCSWWRCARRDGMLLRDSLDALRGVAWVLRERRVVPPHVEAALRTIEAFYGDSERRKRAIATEPSAAKAN
ncbi:MAG TPA: glycosyltransferase [Casimicrobiaceae bacterium]|nr:glycosyltransferase [Casimicrobiaceae bacterium]